MLSVSCLVTAAGPVPDFDLGAKACLAVTGPSGAGKSLMLRAIADLDPAEGNVSLNGRERDSFAPPDWRRQVCYLPAEAAFWLPTLGGHFSRRPEAAALAAMGLSPDRLDAPIRHLSSGERQRGALLRALEKEPLVLLLDEPTGSLDGAAARRVEAVLDDYLRRGGAIVLVTHDEEQAGRVGTHQLSFHA